MPRIIDCNTPAQTDALASALAGCARVGDVILLDGALAAGKTFFTRAFVAALGSDDQVSSPTYTISQLYESPRAPIVHIDAYRLSSAKEFHMLGLEDEIERSITLIEWGTNVAEAVAPALEISIDIGEAEEARSFTLTAHAAHFRAAVEALT